jgi:hypothetical protein
LLARQLHIQLNQPTRHSPHTIHDSQLIMNKIFLCLIVLTICYNTGFSQRRINKKELALYTKNLETYPLLSDSDDDFKVNAAPSKWSDESAVILCQKTTFDFDKQGVSAGKIIGRNIWAAIWAAPTFGTSFIMANSNNQTKILVEETERRKILLNDKFAVEQYSVLYFRLSTEGDAFKARVIKKDGTTQKVDASEAIRVEDVKSVPSLFRSYTDQKYTATYRPDYFKIAVPDLEEGDIIEYEFKNFNNERYSSNPDYKEFQPIYYLCNRSLPVAKQVIEVLAEDDKYYIGYKSMKGAPDFVQTNSKGKRMYRWSDVDRNRIKDTRYVNEYLELPSIKFQMIYARNNSKKFVFFNDEAAMKKDMTEQELSEKAKMFLFSPDKLQVSGNLFAGLKTTTSNTVKTLYKDLKKKGITGAADDEYVRKAYYTIRGKTLYNNWSDFVFVTVFSGLLAEKKIDHDIVVTTYNTRTNLNKVAFTQELAWFIKYKNKYYVNPDEHLNPEELPAYLAGNPAISFNYDNQKAPVIKEVLPVADTSENEVLTQIKANLEPANTANLAVLKTVEAKGLAKADYVDEALALTPFMENDYKNFDGEGMWDGLDTKAADKATAEFNQQKKEWKEDKPLMMKELASGEYNHSIDKYINFRLVQDGRSYKKRSLKYEESFTLADVKASAGEDMLIEIPALIGVQTRLKKEERSRNLPVDVAYPRTMNWNIVFALPAGYTAKGVESLNKRIENETGAFISTCRVENNNLVIDVKKIFKGRIFDAQKWPLLLNVQDAAYAFSQSKVVLSKL